MYIEIRAWQLIICRNNFHIHWDPVITQYLFHKIHTDTLWLVRGELWRFFCDFNFRCIFQLQPLPCLMSYAIMSWNISRVTYNSALLQNGLWNQVLFSPFEWNHLIDGRFNHALSVLVKCDQELSPSTRKANNSIWPCDATWHLTPSSTLVSVMAWRLLQ